MDKNEVIFSTVEIAAKTAVSMIPVGGALVTAIYDAVRGNCLAKRQEKWRATLEERVAKTEETLENIGNNELFSTALIKATEIAMKTASDEKRKYLANAVISSLEPDIDEEILMVFLDLLDRYTISHIKIVYYFTNPSRFETIKNSSYMMGSPKTPLFRVYPELNNELFEKIYKDLYIDGLVNTENLNITMSGSGMIASRTTALGNKFIKFIWAE